MIYNETDRTIKAGSGFILTNGQGVYTKKVYLGKYDKISNWHEITEEEYQEILNKQEGTV